MGMRTDVISILDLEISLLGIQQRRRHGTEEIGKNE